MTLDNFIKSGSIVAEKTSKQEIQELLKVAARSMKDSQVRGLSAEGRFALAYDAALQLSKIVLRCAGYRTRGEGHHWATFDVLPELLGADQTATSDYFQSCRQKRSTAIYHQFSVVTETEVNELLSVVEHFDGKVRGWLAQNHPQYV